MINGTVLDEPELEFGNGGRHVEARFGIMNHGPLDAGTKGAPERIRVGIVGWPAAIDGLREWLGRAREPLPAKKAKYPKQQALFPAFPGFNEDHGFRSLLVLDEHKYAEHLQPSSRIPRITRPSHSGADRRRWIHAGDRLVG